MNRNAWMAAAALAGASWAFAADPAPSAPAASQPAGAVLADGEVRKIDKAQGKITLKHGRIESLDMPGMTMVFRMAEPARLDALKEGDTVKFAAEKRNGAYTVTRIEVAR